MEHSDDRGRFRPCQEDVLEETQLRQTPGAEKGRVPWAAEQPVSRTGVEEQEAPGMPGEVLRSLCGQCGPQDGSAWV